MKRLSDGKETKPEELRANDPKIIAATSLVHRVPLVTRGRKLLRSKTIPLAG